MADLRLARHRRALPLVCVASGLAGCLLYEDPDDPDYVPDAAVPLPDARGIDAPPDAPPIPIDAAIDSPAAAPTIEILTADDTVIAHHEWVRVEARVTGNPIVGFELAVDDAAAPGGLSYSGVPSGGDCYAGCNVVLSFDAATLREGTHTAQFTVRDNLDTRASDSVTLRFEDAPVITFVRPGAEARGAASVGIEVRIVDRGPGSTTATLSIDGASAQSATYADCLAGCPLTFVWDTDTVSAGVHTLSVTAGDAAGRTTTQAHQVLLGDIPYITQLSVTEDDGWGTLEMEVHMYDAASGLWLGCSGDAQGLADVAASGVLYTVIAEFIDASSRPVGVDQLAGRQIRFRVIEDDAARCPSPPGSSDDLVGESGAINAATLATLSTSFGRTNQLTTRHGRPLAR